jgi:uncharacterized membrane protein YeaQ/YmgE (transglycosylase-associated protein family)
MSVSTWVAKGQEARLGHSWHASPVLAAFVSAVAFGFGVGALARWAVPGPDPMPAWLTIFIGLTGSLVGGGMMVALVGTGTRGDLYFTILASIAVSALLVIAYRRFIQGRPVTGPEAQRLPTKGFGIPRLRRRLLQMGIDPDSVGRPGGPRPVAPVETTAAEHDVDLERLENLRKLEDLHDAGLLTDEEFKAKRAALLGERR